MSAPPGNERGNALFLILIAVALFAALAYAVSQSGRGGGSTAKEQTTLDASQLTDYAAAVRTAVTRMTLTGSLPTAVNFDPAAAGADAVFSSAGGSVFPVTPPAGAVSGVGPAATFTTSGPTWRFKAIPVSAANWFVKNIGTTNGADAFTFIGVNYNTCLAINSGLGVTLTAEGNVYRGVDPADMATEADPAVSNSTWALATPTTSSTIGKGYAANPQAFACTQNNVAAIPGGYYIYYHTMIEQ